MKSKALKLTAISVAALAMTASVAMARTRAGIDGRATSGADQTCFMNVAGFGSVPTGAGNQCGTDATTRLWDIPLLWDNIFATNSQPSITLWTQSGTAANLNCTHAAFDASGTLTSAAPFPLPVKNGVKQTLTATAAVNVPVNGGSLIRCNVPGLLPSGAVSSVVGHVVH